MTPFIHKQQNVIGSFNQGLENEIKRKKIRNKTKKEKSKVKKRNETKKIEKRK
jgi:hypothetical protein